MPAANTTASLSGNKQSVPAMLVFNSAEMARSVSTSMSVQLTMEVVRLCAQIQRAASSVAVKMVMKWVRTVSPATRL